MKKFAILLTIALLIGILTGCQADYEPVNNDPSIPAEELQALNADILEAFCQMAGEDLAEVADQLSVRYYWHQ